MCHPCYNHMKRSTLEWIAINDVGQSFYMPDSLFPARMVRATVVARYQEDGGVLVFLKLADLALQDRNWRGIRPFWCPQYGSGGWVDTQKDPRVDALLRELVSKHTREADNCMAL